VVLTACCQQCGGRSNSKTEIYSSSRAGAGESASNAAKALVRTVICRLMQNSAICL
jgi:hypothetical protein